MKQVISPWAAAALIAVVAVLAGAFFVTEPQAYGLCVACHARDLADGTLNLLFRLDLPVSPAASDWPLLTGVGLLVGAHFGARASGETQRRAATRPVKSFFLGMLAMIFSLIALGCTARLLLRAAYGDTLAYWAVGGTALGIAIATGILAFRARR